MSYTIYHADGSPVVVPDNAVDTTFYNDTAHAPGIGIGTQLVGRNAINYGAPVAQNFLQITENFASSVQFRPKNPYVLQGQLWFKKSSENPSADGALYVRISGPSTAAESDSNWKRVLVSNPITPNDGDIRVTGSAALGTLVISIFGDNDWRQVFPAVYS